MVLYRYLLKTMKTEIAYSIEKKVSVNDFIDILNRSGLGERRPVTQTEKIEAMLKHANLVITARAEHKIVGIARALSDFSFCTYLSDLGVDLEFQKSGIGKELIRQVKLATGDAKLILLSAPGAINYYPKIGMKKFSECYILDNVNDL